MPPAYAGVRLEQVAEDRCDLFFDLDQWAFALDDVGLDPTWVRAALEWDRAWAAWQPDDDRCAGIFATYSFAMAVPGGALPTVDVPCAGLTWVGVRPDLRRRGTLRAMIDRHLAEASERGECVSALFAAEPGIYQRFGYGLASRCLALTLPRGAELRPVPGSDDVRVRFERADADRHAGIMSGVYETARLMRPGGMTRHSEGLRRLPFQDPPLRRRGFESLRLALATDAAGTALGYALFRRRQAWSDTGPQGEVEVRDLQALTPAAAHALWSRLLDLDLTAKVTIDLRPVDDAVTGLLVDLRATAARTQDCLWVRLVDVPAALAARRYCTPVDAVLEVHDDLLPANTGRWHLQGGPDGATCTRTTREADLTVDVRDLGACYLGGTSPAALAAAGLLTTRDPSRVQAVATAFASPLAPASTWIF